MRAIIVLLAAATLLGGPSVVLVDGFAPASWPSSLSPPQLNHIMIHRRDFHDKNAAVLPARRRGQSRLLMSSLQLEDAADPMAAAAVTGDAQYDAASLLALETTPTTHLGLPSSSEDAALVRNGVFLGVAAATAVALASVLCLTDASTLHGWTERLARLPVGAWDRYAAALTAHPIATKACTSGLVYAVGDVIAQLQSSSNMQLADLDRARTLRSMTAGLIGHGPLSHAWYNLCDGFFDHVLHWTAWWAVVPKIIVDQTIWGPIWNGLYILLLGTMKRERLDTIGADVKRSTVPLLVSGLKLWPAAHVITYGFLPTEYRLLWVDTVEILWVMILATQAASLGGTTGGDHHHPLEEVVAVAEDEGSSKPTTAAVHAIVSESSAAQT